MSTVKVNKITPRTSNSIQLGESGDTLTIPSGATLQNCGTATGFGISFCTTTKTSPFTATAGKGFFINTGSAVTVTLPASPSVGDELIVVDATGCAATNNITLGRNGSKIKGACRDAKLKVDRGGLRIVYSGSSQGWVTATAGNDAIAETSSFITATGGTVTTVCTNYKVHTFTSDGTFCVSAGAGPKAVVSYMVVAGGGGGGGRHAGGGGGGGYREGKANTPTNPDSYTASPIAAATGIELSPGPYSITVGAGGAAGVFAPAPICSGQQGSNSVFSTITSAGGGGGMTASQDACSPIRVDGGSGGGGAYLGFNNIPSRTPANVGGSGNTPPVSPSQGFDGGTAESGPPYAGAGGGGATAAGADASPGTGGAGATSSITGSPVGRSGGGGGGSYIPSGAAGAASDGGGAGGPEGSVGTAGTANTGGGGGGTGNQQPGNPAPTSPQIGGVGGSGIVVIRYKFQ